MINQDRPQFSWRTLAHAKPILGLAPMDGVTDFAYRYIQKKYGGPDVVFTEFVNVEGLCHQATKLMHHLVYNLPVDRLKLTTGSDSSNQTNTTHNKVNGDKLTSYPSHKRNRERSERPVIAQLYGKTPDCFYQATLLVASMGFDGVDINMGCPAKNVVNNGAGAGLIKTPKLAQAIVQAVQQARADYRAGATLDQTSNISDEIKQVGLKIATLANYQHQHRHHSYERTGSLTAGMEISNQTHLSASRVRSDNFFINRNRPFPISIKTRTGYDKPITQNWITHLLSLNIDALSLHGRTLQQGYGGQANWNEIAKAAELATQTNTVILGNGDIDSFETAQQKITQFEVDGVLIGRASFGNPFVFKPSNFKPKINIFNIAVEHAFLYQNTNKILKSLTPQLNPNFLPMRKNLGWYIKGFPHAKQLRSKLMQTNSAEEVQIILN